MNNYFDMVLMNGKLISCDSQNRTYDAMGVCNDKIVFLGSNDEIEKGINSETKVIDLKGKMVVPGFIDAHNHMVSYGINLMNVNASSPPNETVEEILVKIGEKAKEVPEGQWIRAWGYDDLKLKDKEQLDRWKLDSVAPNHPVMVMRQCLHTCVLNSMGLKIANINKETNDPVGGKIERNPGNGELTGVFRETAVDLIKKVVPEYTKEELREALKKAGQEYLKDGITGIHEAGIGFLQDGTDEFNAYQDVKKYGELPIRVNWMVMEQYVDELITLGIRSGFGNNEMRFGPIKMFLDGALSVKTAAMLEPYPGEEDNKGILTMSQEEVDSKVEKAHKAGLQITAHALGDGAVDQLLNAYEKALEKYPRLDHRHRIEHCGIVNPSIIERMKKLDVIPVPQAGFIYFIGDCFEENLGKECLGRTYALKSFLDAGLIVPGSSDRPVVPATPLQGISSALARKTLKGDVLAPEQSIEIQDALKMYTINSAYASFEEDIKGSLEIGKLADMVVLDEDIFETNPEEIANVKILKTIIGGKVVYDSELEI